MFFMRSIRHEVMDAPTIHVPTEENLGDPINITVDINHPEPVATVAFPAVAVVTTLARQGEAIRGILEHLQGVPIEEDMSLLRFRIGMAEAENASLRAMTIGLDLLKQILNAQTEAHKPENLKHEDVGAVPLDGLHNDDKLHFVEEPVLIMDREVKRLRQSRVPIVKVQWNSKRGPEFTWDVKINSKRSICTYSQRPHRPQVSRLKP
ncbi:hypothetical protein Tco_0689382 [Tanacetum coccineum]